MSGWAVHEGLAVALDMADVDTDQLIPARFMSAPRSEGYGRHLLHDLRFDADGAPLADFPLNRTPQASVLVARRNFGGGSSREAAVYALADFGIRAVVAPSFGDIFASNAINNGLLPARATEEAVDALIACLARHPQGCASARVDLEAGTVTVGAATTRFALDGVWRRKLMRGWDDIDLTRQSAEAIAAFRAERARRRAWAIPQGKVAR